MSIYVITTQINNLPLIMTIKVMWKHKQKSKNKQKITYDEKKQTQLINKKQYVP